MHGFHLTVLSLDFPLGMWARPPSWLHPGAYIAPATDVQTSNPRDPDNYSVFVVNYYPKTAGTEWKADTNRISPHTDETLVTLLFTSPGEF
jgi:hypothetical protein